MDCFWCIVVDGEIVLKEAEAARWLSKDELYNVDWLSADMKLIEKLKSNLLTRDSRFDPGIISEMQNVL